MLGTITWQTRRICRAGILRYCVVHTGGAQPYGLAVYGGGRAALVRQLTEDAARATAWCRRLADGRVRPCHVQELLEDWICE